MQTEPFTLSLYLGDKVGFTMIRSPLLALCQDAGPRPLELKEVFKLFQIQFNRTYSNPAGIMGTDVSSPTSSVHLRDAFMVPDGQ